MKKAVFLLTVAGLALQAWAASYTPCTGQYAGYCSWGPDECYPINKGEDDKLVCADEYDNCFQYGYIYNDEECTEWSGEGNDPDFTVVYCKWSAKCEKVVSQSEKENCEGTNGTLYSDDKCTDRIGGKEPTEPLGCCLWETETECWTIWEGIDPEDEKDGSTKVTDCNRGKNVFWEGACPNTSGTCPTKTPVYNGKSSSSANAGNSSSSATVTLSSSSAGTVAGSSSSATVTPPSSSSAGTVVGSSSSTTTGGTSSSSANTGGSSSSGTSGSFEYCVYMTERVCLKGPYNSCTGTGTLSNSCPAGYDGGDVSPIVVLSNLGYRNGLGIMQNAVNLQITGSTALQIFDLKGNAIRTLKFEQGNYIVPLSDLPNGLYIVKASSASWKQTIKATVR